MADSIIQYALTTAFQPSPSCSPGSFDQLVYQRSLIFNNIPDPIPSSRRDGCYPSQFLDSYFAQKTVPTPLPPFAPLVCPKGFTQISVDYAQNVPDGYIVCCPSGYSLAGPAPPWPATRPAFGASCASLVQSLVVTPYTVNGALPTATWIGTAGDHVYALPLEGYAASSTKSTASQPTTPAISPFATLSTPTVSTTTVIATSMALEPLSMVSISSTIFSSKRAASSGSSPLSGSTGPQTDAYTSRGSATSSTTGPPSTLRTSTTSNSSGIARLDRLSIGQIVGATIGGALAIFIIVAIVFWRVRASIMKSQAKDQDDSSFTL